ncbi:hypothetical protein BO79DRAFT_208026 [Aspergillus costaricaensis CBS 115574]|uniref:Uncharacterized protein n=1 Tax=Aspergillus costaricaensis CBS 115574 TaxID=1448317 RepID=A0ACD1IKX5_9EURO|nr:hypothetical protein BO79DRAFT_208026 [Aspergillus costaricaensis CBS 115574]RAK91135.1 hypothetical protein BO79DRAFT_208026 [Aspergillus costaricaensis CBS 115574]
MSQASHIYRSMKHILAVFSVIFCFSSWLELPYPYSSSYMFFYQWTAKETGRQ